MLVTVVFDIRRVSSLESLWMKLQQDAGGDTFALKTLDNVDVVLPGQLNILVSEEVY